MKATVNGEVREFDDDATLAQMITKLDLPARGIAIAVNDAVIPRAQHDVFRPKGGDAIEIIRAVAGG